MKPRARAVLARAAGERAASLVQRLAHLLQPPINASLLGRANQCSLYVSNKQPIPPGTMSRCQWLSPDSDIPKNVPPGTHE